MGSSPTIIPGRPRALPPSPHKEALDTAFMNYMHKQPVNMGSLWQAINTSAPLSPDIEDRRDPTFVQKMQQKAGYAEMRAGQIWDDIKEQARNAPVQPVDRSFYQPGKDAASQK